MRLCYHQRMRPLSLLALLLVACVAPAAAETRAPAAAAESAAQDPLVDARRLYNLGEYDAAQAAAHRAIEVPHLANGALVVLGRIQLERYRKSGASADLADAREALRQVDARALDERERLEWSIGVAETLYFEDRFGAAAELLEPLIESSTVLGFAAHERLLDWWATSMDRQARARPPADRLPVYERIEKRMMEELGLDPGSSPAGYWLAAAARGRGDVERAYQVAMAGWLRAPQARDRGAALRADLDRLVVQAIIPERIARLAVRDQTQALAGMLGEWEAFKVSWSR